MPNEARGLLERPRDGGHWADAASMGNLGRRPKKAGGQAARECTSAPLWCLCEDDTVGANVALAEWITSGPGVGGGGWIWAAPGSAADPRESAPTPRSHARAPWHIRALRDCVALANARCRSPPDFLHLLFAGLMSEGMTMREKS